MLTLVSPLQFARNFSLSSIYLYRYIHKSNAKKNVIKQNIIWACIYCFLTMGFYQNEEVIAGLVLVLAVFVF